MPQRPAALPHAPVTPSVELAAAYPFVSMVSRTNVKHDTPFLNKVIDAVGDPMWVKDHRLRFLLVNQALCDFTGIPRERFIGRTDTDLHPPEQARVFNEMDRRVMATGQTNVNEENHTHADGSSRTIRTTKTVFVDAKGQQVLVGIFTDLTALRESQRQLELANQRLNDLAHRDSLTTLPNRMAFEAALAHEVSTAQRQEGRFSVLFMDINGFKQINDTHGHVVGDELIRATASRLQHRKRDTDFVARLGGDEFVIIARGTSPLEAGKVAQRLANEVARPFRLSVGKTNITISIGCASYPDDGLAEDELMRNADAAMYRAKRITGQAYELYNEAQSQQAKREYLLQRQLREDVEHGRIDVHVQPVVELAGGRVLGFEALARWQHPEFGPVPPTEFIAMAESCRLIDGLGACVLRKACAFIAAHGAPGQYISVNVSSLQLEKIEFSELVHNVLTDTGAQPGQLALELTESAFTAPESEGVLRQLRSSGIALFVDDFGVGYSNLRRLQFLPFDALKIDRGFVGDLDRDGGGAAMIRTIVVLAAELGLKLIAEGVESEQQAALLQELGVNMGQGYLYSKPMPMAQVFATA